MENVKYMDKYNKPSVVSDVALFTIYEDEKENYRKLPTRQLSILLVKRGIEPFLGEYALPGGFVREGETVEESAYRELSEETGVNNVRLTNLSVFSDANRDPRGWVISCAFIGLTNSRSIKLKAGTDAKDAKWFSVSYKCINEKKDVDKDKYVMVREYELILTNGDESLKSILEIKNQTNNLYKTTSISIKKSEGIAFDHAKIIASAIYELRNNIDTAMFAFDLLPKKFTLTDLQSAYESILDEELITANFRRKITEYVKDTGDYISGAGHRPAKLYERDFEKFF